MKNETKFWTLDELILADKIKLGRGNIISKIDIANFPGEFPIYSSAREKNGTFGYYGKYMFDEELITWSIDGGGRLFYRPRHKFSVTNVGGTLRILDSEFLDCRYLHLVLTYLHSRIRFDWVYKAHPSVIRKVYNEIPIPSLQTQIEIVDKLNGAFSEISQLIDQNESRISLLRQLYNQKIESIFHRNVNNWPQTTIEQACEYKNGKAHEQLVAPNGEFRLVTSKFVSSEGLHSRRVTKALTPLYSGDVAFVLSDLPNGKALAKAFLVTDESDLTLNQRVLRIRSNRFDPNFLYFIVNRNPYLRSFDNGESQTHLKLAQVLACPLLIPDLKTQVKVSKSISELKFQVENSVQILTKKGLLLQTLQQSILHETFNQSETVREVA